MYKLAIEEHDKHWQASADDSLLSGALRAGVPLTYECNSGGCGSCTVEILEGEVENLWEEAPGLSRRDRRKGRLLACQCRPTSDVVFKPVNGFLDALPYPPHSTQATLVERQFLTEDLFEIHLETEMPQAFFSGQYYMLRLPGMEPRAYSVSRPAEGSRISFLVKTVADGQVSPYLAKELAIGDSLKVDGPYGHSYLRASERNVICVAGGSGISPMAAMMRQHSLSNDSRALHLYFGSRCVDELKSVEAYLGDVMDDPRICFTPVLSGDDTDWQGPRGFVHEVLAVACLDFPEHDAYLCGPAPMISATQKLLMLDKKLPFKQLFFDRFF